MPTPIIAAIITATAGLLGVIISIAVNKKKSDSNNSNSIKGKRIKGSELTQKNKSGGGNAVNADGDIEDSKINQSND
jgi:hypothetical protein